MLDDWPEVPVPDDGDFDGTEDELCDLAKKWPFEACSAYPAEIVLTPEIGVQGQPIAVPAWSPF
jgi:hypothetical protein